MEHWNKDNISIKIKKEYNQLENTKKSISELYKFYVESMQNTTHTLRQTIWISLIEEYFEKEPRTFINKYKDSKLNFKNIIKKENEFRNEKSKIPKYETYKEHFIQGINNIFEVLFGANVSIHIFAGKDKNKEIIDYEINEADGLFLACLMTTYHTNDAQNFICGNYDAVSEGFFNLIRPGAESLVKRNKLWLGNRFNQRINGKNMTFAVPDNYPMTGTEVETDKNGRKYISVAGTGWFTNIEHGRRHQPLSLMSESDNIKFSKHSEVKEFGYQKFDHYDAINVPYTDAIPSDYEGLMGVPITFLAKYCPEQFEIVNGMNRYMILGEEELNEKIRLAHSHLCNIDGKASYFRILIRKKAVK